MVKLKNVKVAGSTLIEMLIAMVIIMVVFSIAMALFGNVLQSGVSQKKIQARNQLNLLKNEITKNGYSTVEQMTIDSVDYTISTVDIENTGLSKLEISAKQGQVSLGEIRSVFHTKNRDEKN